jgi:tRNA pseudouridine55 synthase
MSLASTGPTALPPAAARTAAPRARIQRRELHGVLLLDKPLGLSSNQALQRVKYLLRAQKAGHTGTLDPLATGLLPLCFGAATKFSHAALEADKTYVATLRLGISTDSGDAEGRVLQQRAVQFTDAQLDAARQALSGPIWQTPPMHSALKHEGRALYEYAREGVEVEREPRRVTIHRLDILRRDDVTMDIEVCCSKGTYVRTLAHDLGERLGCGAHLTALRRTASGGLRVDQALTLEALQAMSEAERERALLPPDHLMSAWPAVVLGAEDAGRFLSGVRRRGPWAAAPAVRVYGPATDAAPGAQPVFLGSAHVSGGELIPTRLLSPLEVQGLAAQRF